MLNTSRPMPSLSWPEWLLQDGPDETSGLARMFPLLHVWAGCDGCAWAGLPDMVWQCSVIAQALMHTSKGPYV